MTVLLVLVTLVLAAILGLVAAARASQAPLPVPARVRPDARRAKR